MFKINGKEYSQFDINKRCAEIMGLPLFKGCVTKTKGAVWVRIIPNRNYDPCNNPSDTWTIIDKVWDELTTVNNITMGEGVYSSSIEWDDIIEKHNCTKLEAACICFIECIGKGVSDDN